MQAAAALRAPWRGLRQIAVIEIRRMRLAAGCVALIRRQRRVAIDQLDAIERHAEFFGHQLRLRRGDSLAEFFLAGVGGDAAVGADRDPGIELVRRRASRGVGLNLRCASRVASRPTR